MVVFVLTYDVQNHKPRDRAWGEVSKLVHRTPSPWKIGDENVGMISTQGIPQTSTLGFISLLGASLAVWIYFNCKCSDIILGFVLDIFRAIVMLLGREVV